MPCNTMQSDQCEAVKWNEVHCGAERRRPCALYAIYQYMVEYNTMKYIAM